MPALELAGDTDRLLVQADLFERDALQTEKRLHRVGDETLAVGRTLDILDAHPGNQLEEDERAPVDHGMIRCGNHGGHPKVEPLQGVDDPSPPDDIGRPERARAGRRQPEEQATTAGSVVCAHFVG
jgi:hypothetical protein